MADAGWVQLDVTRLGSLYAYLHINSNISIISVQEKKLMARKGHV